MTLDLSPSDSILIDHLTDAWRWWTAPGALIGLILLCPRIYWLFKALKDDRLTMEMVMPASMRLGALIGAAIFMAAALVAGTVIPLATDGRVEGFTETGLPFRYIFGGVWLGFGSAAWIISATLAPRWPFIVLASAISFSAAGFATWSMNGAQL